MAGNRFRGYKGAFCAILGVFTALCLSTSLYASQKVEVESLRVSVSNNTVTVGNTKTALPATALKGRKSITITNNSSNTIYIGDENVTTSNGDPLYKKQSISIDATDAIVIYGVAVSAGNNVRILEFR